MVKSNKPDPSIQKYGVPFYTAGWVPHSQVRSNLRLQSKSDENEDSVKEEESSSSAEENDADHKYYVVLSGGGGEGRSGIPNAVVLAQFDLDSSTLSPEPDAKFGLGSDLPYRMAVHPGGDGLICALPNRCRFIEWDEVKDNEERKLGLKYSERVLTELEDVGQQLALAFNNNSSLLATGGEDGKLKVFKWPSMEVVLDDAEAHSCLKDLCFSPDSKFLVTLGDRGPGRVWDVTSGTPVATLAKSNGEIFASCRFGQGIDNTQVLYIAARTERGGSIIKWDTSTWQRISSKQISRDPFTSFSVSPDGKFVASGTNEGDLFLIKSSSLQVQTVVREAHLGIITALAFSHDSRAVLSASMDASARVTLVEDKKSGGLSLWLIILITLLAIVTYFMKNEGLLPSLG